MVLGFVEVRLFPELEKDDGDDPITNPNIDTDINTNTQVFDHQRRLKIASSSSTDTCDLFSGKWVHDNNSHYPLYKEDECPYLHGDLACLTYGRKDSKFQQWRWQPHGCDFPRATDWGGNKNEGCYGETEPVMDDRFWESGTDPKMLRILESSLNRLKAKGVNVKLINITQLTQCRKDAHPTVHRKLWRPLTDDQQKNPHRASDCTHWCLPGVPDIWNELLLAYIFPATETAGK
ncbi:PC-Esterase [Cynara cardunculus var. scolymus]|uniref:PC-Esterase n=1 Tax=Cynara cardunculus var. scolymus TaxID=59895 RepID=A0A118JVZ8_CYNCS|nr:PC-Esterase [Cynara cardunculus var. scolymus]